MDILERLRAKKGFTNTEIKIADYILENFPKVSAMSARVLAKETFSSNASVLRLCRKIGLSGYRELQVAVLVYLSTRENDGAETESTPRKSAVAEESMAALSGAIQQAAENCRDFIPGGLISRAAERILGANRLFVYGADHFDACLFSQWMAALGIAAIVPDSGRSRRAGRYGFDFLIFRNFRSKFTEKNRVSAAERLLCDSGFRDNSLSGGESCDFSAQREKRIPAD